MSFVESNIQQNISLAPFTTLKIGGAAQYFIEANTTENLIEAVRWAGAKNLPVFVLGGGSNIVVADAGFQGLVIHNRIRGIAFSPTPTEFANSPSPETLVTVGAGENWSAFVELVVAKNLAGVECLSGIPGNVGSTPIQNVGAYGQDVSETIVTVEAFDLQTNALVELSAADCEFGYRASRFKHRDRHRFMVTKVTYKLLHGGKPQIHYAELKKFIDEQGMREPSLAQVSQAVYEIRKRKAMVLSDDPDSQSVGSFFVNPVVSQEALAQIRKRAEKFLQAGEQMPAFAGAGREVKLSAAWLIERAGIRRGTIFGNVGTSSKHALAIINRGGGTAREVIAFADHIKSRVLDSFGVELTPEPVFIGFE
ncbi:MAG: UDP-N-acetylmuramate dehydrogenase [Acidobacteriota bacterium]